MSFALVRAIAVTGLFTLFGMDSTITPSGMFIVAASYGVTVLVFLGYVNLKLNSQPKPCTEPSSSPAKLT